MAALSTKNDGRQKVGVAHQFREDILGADTTRSMPAVCTRGGTGSPPCHRNRSLAAIMVGGFILRNPARLGLGRMDRCSTWVGPRTYLFRGAGRFSCERVVLYKDGHVRRWAAGAASEPAAIGEEADKKDRERMLYDESKTWPDPRRLLVKAAI